MHLPKQVGVFLLSLFILSFFLNFKSLNYYFFQDDWFVLNTIKHIDIKNFPTIFQFRNDIIYYRPVGMQSFFLINYVLFGTNYTFFHLTSYLIFCADIFLFYLISKRLSSSKRIGLLAAFLFSSASFHFMTFSWLSLTWNFIGLAFFLLSLLSYLKIKNPPKIKDSLVPYIFFLLAILSTEFALTLPIFLIVLSLSKRQKFKSILLLQIPYALTILLYLAIRLILIPIPANDTYSPVISFNIARDYLWYILWLLNLPENIKYHLNFTSFTLTKDFTSAAGSLVPFIILTFLGEFVLLTLAIFRFAKKAGCKYLIASLVLFLAALAPVVTLPNHSYPYYLTIAAMPILFLLANAIGSFKSKAMIAVIAFAWLSASFVSSQVSYKTHWVVGEQSISKKISQIAIGAKPENTSVKNIGIFPGSPTVALSLMNQEAMKFIYNDSVRTYYLSEPKEQLESSSLLIIWNK
ncbi:hypothetical protein HY024_05055 [Candidatus Curtissbacteria bacterium]|nr:hypothetical protein [Candidatus Curtissbacteria bacterium]